MLELAIETAARIWAQKLRTNFTQNNGDPEQSWLIQEVASYAAPKPTEVEIILFEQVLAQELAAATVLFYKPTETFYFGVDYNPDAVLFAACKSSGVAWCHLPIKSHTNFNSQQVCYSFGYGTPYTTIDLAQAPTSNLPGYELGN